MEGRKQVGPSSSFPSDLFGTKDSSSSSSKEIFGSVFQPASTVVGRDSSQSEFIGSSRKQESANHVWNSKQGVPDSNAQNSSSIPNKDRRPIFQDERVEPCYLSSSLYYGGQDIYSNPTSTPASGLNHVKNGEEDPNGNNLDSASRGNWWQGSLYY